MQTAVSSQATSMPMQLQRAELLFSFSSDVSGHLNCGFVSVVNFSITLSFSHIVVDCSFRLVVVDYHSNAPETTILKNRYTGHFLSNSHFKHVYNKDFI